MARKLPFVSIVVCCYNGADVLPGCLEALQKQNWKGKLEIIVVDDGSVDATSDIAQSYKKVRVIRNKQNLGLAGSRNVGIAAAKGEIVAFTDDDCRPKPSWIAELHAGYVRQPDAQGIGGGAESTDHSNLVLRYLQASKPLAPLEKTLLASNGFLYRFGLYLKGLLGIGSRQKASRRMRPVYSLVGANMSFRKSALQAVDMFDDRFRFGGEEEDLCKRLHEAYPGSLYFVPKAKIVHQYDRRLRDTLRRSQAYGKGNARMSRKHADVRPVIYPFPPCIVATVVLGVIHPLLALSPIVLVPLVYARWLGYALRMRQPEALVYSYIQCAQEWYSNIGFVKGWWQFRNLFKPAYAHMPGQHTLPEAPPTAKQPRWLLSRRMIVVGVLAATAIFLLASLTDGLVRLIATLPFLLVVPGFLALVALKVPLQGIRGVLYIVSASVSSLLLLSLLLNTLVLLFGKRFGLDEPLFMIGVTAWVCALLVVVWWRLRDATVTVPRLYARQWLLLLPFILLPFVGAGAAFYLNNTSNNTPAMIVLGTVALVLLGLIVWLRKHDSWLVPAVLYLVSFTLILLGALRGDFVSGTDINKEFYLFNLTNKVGYWSPSLYNDAYNACLGINLLPVLLHKITGLSGEIIFRVLLPATYAMVPVMVYALCLGRVRKIVACIAVAFFIAQPVFLTWASIPLRQMLGFVFFGALLLAILDKGLARWARGVLIVLFGTAMILSHYSTAYIALACLVLAYAIELSGHGIDRARVKWKVDRFKPTIRLSLILLLIGIAAVWYGPVNHVSNNLTDRVQKVATEMTSGEWSIYNAFNDEKHAEQTSLIDQFNLQSKPRDTEQVWDAYLAATETKYAGTDIVPVADREEAPIQPAPLALLPARVSDGPLQVLSLVGQALSKLMRVFLVIGIITFAYYFWRRRYRDEHDYMAFALASAVIVLSIMVMPYASLDYDLVRTTQQLLLLLALPTVLGGMYLVQFLFRGKAPETRQALFIGVSVLGFFLYMSGFIPQLTGGATPTVLLNNTGNQYNQLYVHAGEVAAADWLRQHKDPRPYIHSGYFGGNRLWLGGVDRPLFYNDTLPWTIDQNGYVYASYAESQQGIATAYYKGSFVQYEYPTDVLNAKKDVLYSNGQAVIYQ